MWKARVLFGDVEVPVKLYSAVQDRGVRFRLLDRSDKQPVKQEMVDPRTDEVIEYEHVRRAFPTDDGHLVLLDEEELDALEPEPSREIRISRFIDDSAIPHLWFDRPYYLGPDASDPAYFTLVRALRDAGKQGVAQWVMRKKEYAGALRVEGDYLLLMTLRHAGEVVPATALPAPRGRALEKSELRMAKQLVAAMEDELDLAAFRDEYRERVLELVEAKAEGKVVSLPKPKPKKAEEKSLREMLERSLESAKERKKSA